jgi:hypothetical protein
MAGPELLTAKALNRATLARQMLLARERTTALGAIERLVGLQAQLARPPFIGLWSRVAGFRAEDLARLARDRKVVRATIGGRADLRTLVLRYLGGFGPASVADAQTWSGVGGLKETFEEPASSAAPGGSSAAGRLRYWSSSGSRP